MWWISKRLLIFLQVLEDWRWIWVKSPMLQSSSFCLVTWLQERLLSGRSSTETVIKLVSWTFFGYKNTFIPKFHHENRGCWWGDSTCTGLSPPVCGWLTDNRVLPPASLFIFTLLVPNNETRGVRFVIKSYYLLQAERRSRARWRNPSNVVPAEPPAQLLQSCPKRMVSPGLGLRPIRGVDGKGKDPGRTVRNRQKKIRGERLTGADCYRASSLQELKHVFTDQMWHTDIAEQNAPWGILGKPQGTGVIMSLLHHM